MSEIILPLFPLNLVAFPGENLNLHIFEPRYRQLIHECNEHGTTFIICPHYKGENISMGTEMKLVRIEKKYPNGKMDVRTKGIGLVKIDAFYKEVVGKLYPGAEIRRMPWDEASDFALNKRLIPMVEELYMLMNVKNVEIQSPTRFRTFQVAHKVGLNFDQELKFLSMPTEKERQVYLLSHLENILPILHEMEEMKRKAKLNGHFKNMPSGDV